MQRPHRIERRRRQIEIAIQRPKKMTPSANRPFATPLDLYRAVACVWSADTASPTGAWTASNPAMNHCSITSLVAQDLFGGEILCTKTSGGIHFYNRIDGVKWDLTASQFVGPIPYDDTFASREQAFADTSFEKYHFIKARLARFAAGLPTPDDTGE